MCDAGGNVWQGVGRGGEGVVVPPRRVCATRPGPDRRAAGEAPRASQPPLFAGRRPPPAPQVSLLASAYSAGRNRLGQIPPLRWPRRGADPPEFPPVRLIDLPATWPRRPPGRSGRYGPAASGPERTVADVKTKGSHGPACLYTAPCSAALTRWSRTFCPG